MHNPSGDIDIARIDDVLNWIPKVGKEILEKRGKEAAVDGHFAYYLGKTGVWVRRVAQELYDVGGLTAFKPPYEHGKSHRQFYNWAKEESEKQKTLA